MWIYSLFGEFHVYMFLMLAGRVAGYHYLHEGQLNKDLMTEYNRDVRPAEDSEEPVLVKIYPTVVRIDGLDEGKAMLETTISLSMSWSDSRLKWHSLDYGGITQTHVTLDKLWKPDIAPSNGISLPRDTVTMAAVSSSGTVAAVLLQKSQTYCDLDLTRFPHDTQSCDILFGSWIYSYSQLAMEFWDGNKYSMKLSISGSGKTDRNVWTVEETTAEAKIYNVTHECCPDDPFVQLKVSLQLVRQSSYLSRVLVCQLLAFLLLIPVQFVLPPLSHERTMFGMLVLIGGLLLTHSLLQFIPHVSSSATWMGHLYIANFCLALVGLILSTLVTWVSCQQVKGRPMPVPIRTLLQCLRRVCHYNEESPKGKIFVPNDEPDDDNYVELDTFRELHDQNGHTGLTDHIDTSINSIDTSTLVVTLKDTNRLLKQFGRLFVNKEVHKHGSSDWGDFASLLDRVCFVLFCLVSIVIIIIVLTI